MSQTDAKWAGAVVILHGGLRLGWKVVRGSVPGRWINSRYFGGHPPDECENVIRSFDDPGAFDAACAWARSYPRHPDASGMEP